MSTKTVTLNEVQSNLPDLLAFILEGNEVIISDKKKNIARLVPIVSPQKQRIAGLNRGAIKMSKDFDEPLLNTKSEI